MHTALQYEHDDDNLAPIHERMIWDIDHIERV